MAGAHENQIIERRDGRALPGDGAGPDGRWAAYSARRRADLWSAGVLAGSGTVIDLTGPEPRVTFRPTPPPAPVRQPVAVIPTRLVGIAALAIVVLNLLDIVTTTAALAAGGTEGNPLADLFVHHLPIFIAIKVIFPGLVAWRMWSIRDQITPMLLAAMWWVVGAYSLAIAVNTLHLF